MIKSIIIVLTILSLVMLGCLNEEKRMAAVYHKNQSPTNTQVLLKTNNTVIPDQIENLDIKSMKTTHIQNQNDEEDLNEENVEEDNTDDEQNNLNPNTLNSFKYPALTLQKKTKAYQQVTSGKRVNPQQKQLDYQYKTSVLMRIASGVTATKSITPTDEAGSVESNLSQDEEAKELVELSDQELSDILDSAPEQSEEAIESSKSFNFNMQKTRSISVNSADESGELVPHARFTIENSSGNIILEGNTNESGQFTSQIVQFNQAPVYLRYHTIGLNQERVLISEEEIK